MGWVGLCLALLVLITVGFGTLGGKGVVMASRALLSGTLPFRYCAARFACLTPTWRLPVPGYVVNLVAASVGAGHRVAVDEVDRDVFWVSGSGPGRKRIRLNRKILHTSRGSWFILVHGYGRG